MSEGSALKWTGLRHIEVWHNYTQSTMSCKNSSKKTENKSRILRQRIIATFSTLKLISSTLKLEFSTSILENQNLILEIPTLNGYSSFKAWISSLG